MLLVFCLYWAVSQYVEGGWHATKVLSHNQKWDVTTTHTSQTTDARRANVIFFNYSPHNVERNCWQVCVCGAFPVENSNGRYSWGELTCSSPLIYNQAPLPLPKLAFFGSSNYQYGSVHIESKLQNLSLESYERSKCHCIYVFLQSMITFHWILGHLVSPPLIHKLFIRWSNPCPDCIWDIVSWEEGVGAPPKLNL